MRRNLGRILLILFRSAAQDPWEGVDLPFAKESVMRLTVAFLAAATVSVLASLPAFGHGSMADPPSRSYKIFLDGPMTP